MHLTMKCGQVVAELADEIINHAIWASPTNELSNVVTAMFQLEKAVFDQIWEPPLRDAAIRHNVNARVLEQLLNNEHDDEKLKNALPRLVEIAKANKQFDEAIDEIYEWFQTDNGSLAILEDRYHIKKLGELYKLKRNSPVANAAPPNSVLPAQSQSPT